MMKSTDCYKICPLVRIGPKTKLSRQVRDILKKTKGVIIIIIVHVLWHPGTFLGTVVLCKHQLDNQAGPRGEKF